MSKSYNKNKKLKSDKKSFLNYVLNNSKAKGNAEDLEFKRAKEMINSLSSTEFYRHKKRFNLKLVRAKEFVHFINNETYSFYHLFKDKSGFYVIMSMKQEKPNHQKGFNNPIDWVETDYMGIIDIHKQNESLRFAIYDWQFKVKNDLKEFYRTKTLAYYLPPGYSTCLIV